MVNGDRDGEDESSLLLACSALEEHGQGRDREVRARAKLGHTGQRH